MKIRIKFRKQGTMKFIGHLDIMRYFQKVMRRADVDIRYSEGFSPHQIMSFAAPLGVGLLSNGEYVDIEVLSTEDSRTMIRRMNQVMAEGMEVVSYKKLEDSAKSAMSLVAAADYILTFRPGKAPENPDEFFSVLERFYNREQILIEKKTKKGFKEIDLKPLIYEMRRVKTPQSIAKSLGITVEEADCAGPNGNSVFMKLSTGSTDNIKPELVMEAFYQAMGWEYPAFAFQIEREEVYADMNPENHTGSGNCRSLVPLEELGEDIE